MRRTRIKGIANIPQRKKTEPADKSEQEINNQQQVLKSENGSQEDNSMKSQSTFIANNLVNEKTILNEVTQNVVKSDRDKIDTDPVNSVVDKFNEPFITPKKPDISILGSVLHKTDKIDTDPVNSVVDKVNEPFITPKKPDISILGNVLIKSESKISNSAQIQGDSASNLKKNECNESEKKPFRRRAIKPSISVNAISGRSCIKTLSSVNVNVNMEQTNSDKELTEIKVDKQLSEKESLEQKIGNIESGAENVPESNSQYSTNQLISEELNHVKSPVYNLDIKKSSAQHVNVGSDCEYPPPPPSPNKLNRSRIKAIPRISNRKISFSASESEDEYKKHEHRVRHDSQSSNLSTTHESAIEQPSTPKVVEFSSVIQRKCKRTEWSRKLAEARREFTRKFMSGKPDHKKLTMIDLIFYNPTTNAMKNEKRTISESDSKSNPKNDEEVDNPSETEDNPTEVQDEEASRQSDEENEVPAPQIRIGPSGEIILDEKSLVIENKQTIINREQLQKSQVVDGDGDRPYGVFKKVKRSKDWTHSETLRFYKALSTIGTDFTLMCELFPNRTRRELKMKFKKEEKINQTLVDKAVMEPCSFDFEELKKEFELVEIERKELQKQRIQEEQLKKTKGIKKSIKFLKLTEQNDKKQKQSSTDSIVIPNDDLQLEIQKMDNNMKEATKIGKKQGKLKVSNYKTKEPQRKFDIMSVLSDSDSTSGDSGDSEIIWKPVQTRYGRKTRKRQIFEPEGKIQEEMIIPRKIHKPNLDTEQEQQKPGSLMMISSKAPDGQPIVQIFMVTDKNVQNGKNIEGIHDLNTDNLLPIAMIKTGHTDDEEEEIIENNYTIPAEPENQNANVTDSVEVDSLKNLENKIDDSIQT